MKWLMAHVRQARSPVPQLPPEKTCLEVYEQELDYLLETLRRLGANPREIEDLAQDVFVVLHRKWSSLDVNLPLRPYLFGVAFRIVWAHRRRGKREVPRSTVELEDQGPSPEGLLESKELARILMAALDTIPLPRRAVVIMHDLDGFAMVDIAAKLSITRFGAYARLNKGRRELASAVRKLLRERAR
jgi:RNA polymerase sigma factor (sigma-70 family)